MKNDLQNIKKICSNYITEPKLLIVPSASLKGSLEKTLLDNNIPFINLEMKTIDEVALDIIKYKISDFTIIDSRGVEDAIHDVLVELKNKLSYFGTLQITNGLDKQIATTVIELKEAGYNDNKIEFNLVENINKKNDLIAIMNAYNFYLKENKCIDKADIIEMAINNIQNKYANIYALETCEFSYLEKKLLSKLNYSFNDIDDSKYLNYKEICKNIKDAEVKKTYGDSIEVKEVLRTIINNRIPFDEVCMVSLNSEPYASLFYQQLLKYTYNNSIIDNEEIIPMTFGTGVPISLSCPAEFLLNLLTWISDGYSAHDFSTLLVSRSFNRKSENDISRNEIISTIRYSELKWQRSTYINTFNKYLEKNVGKERRELVTKFLMEIVTDLLNNIPENDEDGYVLVDTLVLGIKNILKKYCKVVCVLDSEAYDKIFNELDSVIKGRNVIISEFVSNIKDRISDMRIGSRGPISSKMYFTTFHGAEWVKRKYTFLIGLDVQRFPSKINQNPILLDDEREEGLLKSSHYLEKNIKDMSRLLESIDGKTFISYSYFDTAQNRENYSSAVYNAVIESLASDKGIDTFTYLDKYEKTINFTIKDINDSIDEEDYVLTKLVDNKLLKLKRNLSKEISQELGSIDVSDVKFEFSPSSLMVYLDCRYKYFLKYVLGLTSQKEIELDKLGWLSYFNKGTLYHEIFEEFENSVIEDGKVLKDYESASLKIREIYDEVLKRYEEELPTASDFDTENEKEKILNNVIRFAKNEVDNKESFMPLLTEFEFGNDEDLFIEVNGEKIYINGIVDRVDFNRKNNTLKIIDYKTGSTFEYDILNNDGANYINKKSIQPILYYIALNKLAEMHIEKYKDFRNISLAEYYFVTERGNYEKFYIEFNNDKMDKILEELKAITDRIKSGDFSVEKEHNCEYCDYSNTCNRRRGE